MTLSGQRILLVIGGGIAAYKALELIRRLRERGAAVVPVMTAAASEFVTPLSVGALAASRVYCDLFDREDEQDVGHIRLARNCDAVIVAPATADRMARLAAGLAEDLAGAVLLATRASILMAPAMNPAMWDHPATVRNVERLKGDGVRFVGPNGGEMAEANESGIGRMAEPLEIVAALEILLKPAAQPLAGKRVVVTSGPTHEPIDPVRYIANRSSGRQGHAIAGALARLGAEVTLVSGPVNIPSPPGVTTIAVDTAREMLAAVEAVLPVDVGVFVAAVADWRTADAAAFKLKKSKQAPAPLELTENPDILATVGHHRERPALVVGFAAETNDLIANAVSKLDRKGADIIVANDVSQGEGREGVMGGVTNTVHLVTRSGSEAWPVMTKEAVAERLAQRIAEMLAATIG